MTAKPYRVVIAEDHRILREGLRALLSTDPHYQIVGEAEDGLAAIRCVDRLKPDLILLDLSMPKMTGLDAIGEIKRQSPDTKVLVLTVHKVEEYVFEALEAGADGYLLKDATHGELMLAAANVLAGKSYLSPGISRDLVSAYLKGKGTLKPRLSLDKLTRRERQVLKLVGEGFKNKEIADYLCISVKTVEKHRANLMRKLDLHTASALTAFAVNKGLTNE